MIMGIIQTFFYLVANIYSGYFVNHLSVCKTIVKTVCKSIYYCLLHKNVKLINAIKQICCKGKIYKFSLKGFSMKNCFYLVYKGIILHYFSLNVRSVIFFS